VISTNIVPGAVAGGVHVAVFGLPVYCIDSHVDGGIRLSINNAVLFRRGSVRWIIPVSGQDALLVHALHRQIMRELYIVQPDSTCV
jgi:hypothetical protein